MNPLQKCEICNNTAGRLRENSAAAYYLCLADIGPTWFRDYGDKCLACALLATVGLRPNSYEELSTRWKLLGTAASAPSAADVPDTPDFPNTSNSIPN